jgi:hypothetical protein
MALGNYTAGGFYFALEGDIDLTGADFTTIPAFSGALDGNGHSVTGVASTLIANIPFPGAEIKNLNISAADNGEFAEYTAISNYILGGILAANAANLSLENISIEGSYAHSALSSAKQLGLAVGKAVNLTADNLTLKGEIYLETDSNAEIGLLAGNINYAYLTNIRASGKITSESTVANNSDILGGLAGSADNTTVNGCGIRADINSDFPQSYAGGVIGSMNAGGRIERCYFVGNITSKKQDSANRYLGGIAGYSKGASRGANIIDSSYSAGRVTILGSTTGGSYAYAGGILGYSDTTSTIFHSITINGSYSAAGVESFDSAGGIVGNGNALANVRYSFALNEFVDGMIASGRIGTNLYPESGNNLAYIDLWLKRRPVEYGTIADGISVERGALTQANFISAGFSESVWDLDFNGRNYKLPVLKALGMEQAEFEMPKYW